MVNEDIFTVENHILIINKEYVRGIPEFKTILERDKGSKGDMDGRKKFRAWKEFFYIYMIGSLFSYPNKGGYNEKDTHKAGIKESGLDEDFKPDVSIRAAIIKYKEIQIASLPTLSTIHTVLKGLRSADTVSQIIIEGIEERLERYKEAKKLREERKDLKPTTGMIPAGSNLPPTNIVDEVQIVDGAITQIEKLMSLANKLPNTINTLELLDDRLRKEQAGNNLVRGGREKGSRADPR